MKLRAKSLKLFAGRPVAILQFKIARRLGLHVDDRVEIKSKKGKIIAIVDTAFGGIVEKAEIALSEEVIKKLAIKSGDFVSISYAPSRQSVHYIYEKLHGMTLTDKKISAIIQDIVNNALTESEIAYFVSAMFTRDMTEDEIANLTRAMVETGCRLNLNEKIIADKHSIGGIPNNRTTPIVVSICTAAGLTMPKTSSRAITSPAGTADVIEVIAPVEFNIKKMKEIIKKTGGCMVWGGALGLAPADDKIIQVERLISLDPETQLIASILAKKISVGATHILLDIPYGKSAKVLKNEAEKLALRFGRIAKILKLNLKVILTDGNQPIGNGVGPVLELKDILLILKREKNAPKDLENKSLLISGKLLEITGKVPAGRGFSTAKEILESGRAYKKFKDIILAQGGSLNNLDDKLKLAKFSYDIKAEKNGKIRFIDNKKISAVARMAGAPVDKDTGLYLYKHLNEEVKKGDKIITIYSETKDKLKECIDLYRYVKPVLY